MASESRGKLWFDYIYLDSSERLWMKRNYACSTFYKTISKMRMPVYNKVWFCYYGVDNKTCHNLWNNNAISIRSSYQLGRLLFSRKFSRSVKLIFVRTVPYSCYFITNLIDTLSLLVTEAFLRPHPHFVFKFINVL